MNVERPDLVKEVLARASQIATDTQELAHLSEMERHRRLLDHYSVEAMAALAALRAVPVDENFEAGIAKKAWDLAEAMIEERERRRTKHLERMRELTQKLSSREGKDASSR